MSGDREVGDVLDRITMRRMRRLEEALFAVGCFSAYLLTAVWAREVSLDDSVLIWFPPAAVAMVATFFRPWLVAVVAAAEMVSTPVVMGMGAEFGVLPLGVNSVGLAACYGLAGLMMRRLLLDWRMRTSDDILVFSFGTMVVGSVCAATFGVAIQVWIGVVDSSQYLNNVAIFWVGDVVGAATVGPILLLAAGAWSSRSTLPFTDRKVRPKMAPVLVVEYAVPAVTVFLCMVIVDDPMRFTYLAFIPLVMVALRHGVAGAAWSVAGMAAVMLAGAEAQVHGTLERSDVQLQLTVLCLAAMVTGAVVSARLDVLKGSERVRSIIDVTPDLVGSVDADGLITYLNPVGRELLGLRADEPVRLHAEAFFPDQLAVDLMYEAVKAADRNGTWSGDTHLRRADGSTVPVSQVIVAHRHPGDDSVTYSTICRDTTDRLVLEDQLRRAVLHDEATGLPNRALLFERMEGMSETVEGSRPTAILFLDVKHLARVNETFGFQIGDQVVTQLAQRIEGRVRIQDLVARYGGSRFVVLMPDIVDEFEAVIVADRLLSCFNQSVVVDDHEIQVTGSVGIAISEPGQPYTDVLRRAEIALHRAHEAGGGQFAVFDEEIQRRAQERIEREVDLREVLSSRSWTLAYQPVVDPRSNITGVEALLRYDHPTRGPVAPYELIRLAEHSGSIVPLGSQIFSRACRDAMEWHAHGFDLTVAINVSSLQLRDPDFVSGVQAVVDDVGIDPEKLVVELTETVLATNDHGEIDALQRLRELGLKVALDDFGTGYSSFSGLGKLPVDELKLDRTFVAALDDGAQAAVALVESVVALAEAVGLSMVAEGVETDEQFAKLVELGCDRFQGYLFSRPLDHGSMTGLLERSRVASTPGADPSAETPIARVL